MSEFELAELAGTSMSNFLTSFTVFVSMDVGMTFDVDSVQLKLNDNVVANHPGARSTE